MYALLRTLCPLPPTAESLIKSWHFKDLNEDFKLLSSAYKDEQTYLFLELPRIVIQECKRDEEFTSKLISQLQ